MSEAPPFWWEPPDWRALALAPASAAYALVAARMMQRARRVKVPVPVLCVGNLTVGGAGKTPVAIALAAAAERAGLRPGFLSRGYGGSVSQPHLVDANHDSARHVGDEPLLLVRAAPTMVSPDRALGAKLLVERGTDFLIMDDGFQSARIHMDFALIVVDGRRGIGNGHVIPGGPLRARVVDQMRFASAVLAIGEGGAAETVVRQAARAGRPLYRASTRPRDAAAIAGRRFLAFAGIGDPEKFFQSVAAAGGMVVATRRFADHHSFTADELSDLVRQADGEGLELITTAKDAVRISTSHGLGGIAGDGLCVLEIETVFEPAGAADAIVEETLRAYRRRA